MKESWVSALGRAAQEVVQSEVGAGRQCDRRLCDRPCRAYRVTNCAGISWKHSAAAQETHPTQQSCLFHRRLRIGRGLKVDPTAGGIAVNIGDMLSRWSDGPPPFAHRVRSMRVAQSATAPLRHMVPAGLPRRRGGRASPSGSPIRSSRHYRELAQTRQRRGLSYQGSDVPGKSASRVFAPPTTTRSVAARVPPTDSICGSVQRVEPDSTDLRAAVRAPPVSPILVPDPRTVACARPHLTRPPHTHIFLRSRAQFSATATASALG